VRRPTTTQLSMLTAVLDGHEEPLRAALARLPGRDGSPFAAVHGTHNGRLVVVDTAPAPDAPLRVGGLDAPMLMCSAVIDREPREWLRDLLQVLGSTAEEIWTHCPGWPAGAGTDAQLDFLLAHRTASSLEFATWDAPVDEVRAALALHQRLAAFAVRAQHLGGEQLVSAFRAEFGRRRDEEHR
jgi:hypothetical protein